MRCPIAPVCRRLALAALLLPGLAGAAVPAPQGSPSILTGTAEAVEGDILTVEGQAIRLHGIDAPDAGQVCRTKLGRDYDCGAAARDMLARLVAGRTVDCELVPGPGLDGKRVGICRIGGRSVGGALVLRGWAFAAVRLSPAYVRLQAHAQSRKAGMWAGRVEAPWLWRSRRTEAGKP